MTVNRAEKAQTFTDAAAAVLRAAEAEDRQGLYRAFDDLAAALENPPACPTAVLRELVEAAEESSDLAELRHNESERRLHAAIAAIRPYLSEGERSG